MVLTIVSTWGMPHERMISVSRSDVVSSRSNRRQISISSRRTFRASSPSVARRSGRGVAARRSTSSCSMLWRSRIRRGPSGRRNWPMGVMSTITTSYSLRGHDPVQRPLELGAAVGEVLVRVHGRQRQARCSFESDGLASMHHDTAADRLEVSHRVLVGPGPVGQQADVGERAEHADLVVQPDGAAEHEGIGLEGRDDQRLHRRKLTP